MTYAILKTLYTLRALSAIYALCKNVLPTSTLVVGTIHKLTIFNKYCKLLPKTHLFPKGHVQILKNVLREAVGPGVTKIYTIDINNITYRIHIQ